MHRTKGSWLKYCLALGLSSLGALFSGCGDDSQTQSVRPAVLGQRGESCLARNDCESGLACLNNVCSRNDFEITRSSKECVRVDCKKTADCCGGRPTKAPAKCADVTQVCNTPTLAGCTLGASCESAVDCGGGSCSTGVCSQVALSCTTDAGCEDVCDTTTGFCTISSAVACTVSTDCTYGVGTCGSRICNSCANPDYDPSAEICSDPDCIDICTLRCQNELCVEDTSCEVNEDCADSPAGPICDDGQCAECVEDDDCDEANEEECLSGRCEKPCEVNEECPLNNTCKKGECVYTGCSSDLDCVLIERAHPTLGDARLSKCLPSDLNPDINECKVPCENDGTCAEFQVCDDGFCKFVGCNTDEECRSYLGLAPDPASPKPKYVSKAVCRAPELDD